MFLPHVERVVMTVALANGNRQLYREWEKTFMSGILQESS
ncbi:hypothetical protein CLOSTMETH_03092 [[Clostridium] methylpentosum DSM 5476]|uniref:Uncharacterized protein n=1 Tax=[Clostridium] methylpentosum DSM 5476 TaxID=537013 RepID=C0EGU8_9FIRM|nr:hypothetical protein CLOSTMETH_03092 [[Clostridium] methylpentosum DSM 5476]